MNCVLVLNPPTRIYEAIPQGTAALSSVLFFDEINRDSKGFVSADGVIIVGGFSTGTLAFPPSSCPTLRLLYA